MKTINNMKPIMVKESPILVKEFTSTYSLSIVVGQCNVFPYWLKEIECTEGLQIYIYLKCQFTEEEVRANLKAQVNCIIPVSLKSKEFKGQAGTIKHFLYNNYNNLSDYSLFVKDNNRKSAGLEIVQRVASALLTVQISPKAIRFITLSDIPTWHQHKLRDHTQKTRSVRMSYRKAEEIQDCRHRQNPESYVAKYCAEFERLTCTPCKSVWIPVRSQFMVSREAVKAVNRDEYDWQISEHGEYTWAILFGCYQEVLNSRKTRPVYPYFLCE